MGKNVITFILLLFGTLFAKCRNCDIVIDTTKAVKYEKFISDTFFNANGNRIVPSKFIGAGYNVFVVIRVGDRPARILTSVNAVSEVLQKCRNISLFFVLLDSDSQIASQTSSELKSKIKTGEFRLFYTNRYTDSEGSIKVSCWQLEATPAILVYNQKEGEAVFYPVFLSAKELADRIADKINCQ